MNFGPPSLNSPEMVLKSSSLSKESKRILIRIFYIPDMHNFWVVNAHDHKRLNGERNTNFSDIWQLSICNNLNIKSYKQKSKGIKQTVISNWSPSYDPLAKGNSENELIRENMVFL